MGAAGNGAAIISNQLLVQRGAPDRYRGRALATIMSTNYAVLGLAMAAAGVLTDAFGARWIWAVAGVVYAFAAALTLVVTRWLPVAPAEEGVVLDAHAEEAAGALVAVPGGAYASAVIASEPVEVLVDPTREGSARGGLDRIASLLEEIEQRREVEAGRTPTQT